MTDKIHKGRLEGWEKKFVVTGGLGFVITASNGATDTVFSMIEQPDGTFEIETKNYRYTLGTPASA